MKDISGIYRIRNTVNGKYYVGSSYRCNHRWNEHRRDLRANRHANAYLQAAWNKYGEKAFTFEVKDTLPRERLLDIESFYTSFKPLEQDLMYNLNDRTDAPPIRKGNANGRYDTAVYTLVNRHSKERFLGTQLEFKTKYSFSDKSLSYVLHPRNGRTSYLGWTLEME